MKTGFTKHATAALLAFGTLTALMGCTAQDSQAQTLPKLTGGEWLIENIAGAGIIGGSAPTLSFATDGSLGGSLGCNRLIANYKTQGASLTITAIGSTRKLCADTLMRQEQRLTNLLAQVKSYGESQAGALVLRTASGKTITARRR